LGSESAGNESGGREGGHCGHRVTARLQPPLKSELFT
jgi:hypothetical protein